MTTGWVTVSVVWATPDVQDIVPLVLPVGSSIATAIVESGLTPRHSIDVAAMRVGINGRLAQSDTILADGDRVEIYRPLVADPKEARRARAQERPCPKSHPAPKSRKRP